MTPPGFSALRMFFSPATGLAKNIVPKRDSVEGPIPGFVRAADRATGWLVIACTGTGCAYRVPIIYTEAMLDSVNGYGYGQTRSRKCRRGD
jgi:hypothetical protein